MSEPIVDDLKSESINQNLTFHSFLSEKGNPELCRKKDQYSKFQFLLSDQNSYEIKLMFFDSSDKKNLIHYMEFKGCILEQTQRVLKELENPPIPYNMDFQIVKEIVMNAIVHRDYSLLSPIMISIYTNRAEIISPGGLQGDVVLEDILLGLTAQRNHDLFSLYESMNYTKGIGYGLSYLQNFSNYKIQSSQNAFSVSIPFEDKIELSPYSKEYEVLTFMKNHPSITREQIQTEFGFKLTRTRNILTRLELLGYITRYGQGKNIVYVANSL